MPQRSLLQKPRHNGCQGQKASLSKQEQLPPGWCICYGPPGRGKALQFSKQPSENAATAIRSASRLSNQSNPFLLKFTQVPALRGCFSTVSPLRCHQLALWSGRSRGQDLMRCLVILPAEGVQWHKLII